MKEVHIRNRGNRLFEYIGPSKLPKPIVLKRVVLADRRLAADPYLEPIANPSTFMRDELLFHVENRLRF